MVHLNPFHENKSKAPVPPNMEREAHDEPVDILHGRSVHRRGVSSCDPSGGS
ncbi:hypothetical protein SERLADRAFT_372163 [Serpula lacrymans var. lacrymans S7.9]|uniref:Uncharacterized protein n=1 Tax=Serpula lacrymans var. lacrymans (strain S7.9) TaxID=578457 RepID=F8P4H8_SERL9|nr:uncharacterized protein SERLADRAFT_372163 [Serpula lacrymans var. lacrymans S7.9]EGO21516.1 hypothetical protein SERLADRAFT_372163 [Serpula lacrymans var. lacrymans S7.9]